MLSVICLIFVSFFCHILIAEASIHTKSVEKYHKDITNSLNVSELNITTLDLLLQRLHLDNCSAREEVETCGINKCLTPRCLYKANSWNNSTVIEPSLLQDLSSALLYFLLPEKNAGQYAGPSENRQHGGLDRISYQQFLQYYRTNGLICDRFLDRILRDINETFGNSVVKPCFSAVDVFNELNLSTSYGDLNGKHFPLISLVIVSQLVEGKCIMSGKTNDLELPCNSYFTSNLVDRFGNGSTGTIPIAGFNDLLRGLGIGMVRSGSGGVDKCYSSRELFNIYSLNESAALHVKMLKEICPSLIQQLVSKSCDETTKEDIHDDEYKEKFVWMYGFLAVLVISLLSLAGIAVIPTMKGLLYKKIIIVLVGLAIGTLAGDALLHLIPHAAGLHSEGHDDSPDDEKAFIWKFVVVASGVYGFFLFETLTHLFLRTSGHGHSHNIEHTRKHSPFERNNSCRTVERHEMRGLGRNPGHSADIPRVITNMATDSPDKNTDKLNLRDGQPKSDHDNLPNLLEESPDGHNKRISSVGWMIIIGDTIHNITDGIAIGAAFSVDLGGGISTTIAVFCHELPHELGDFAVLISSGMTVKQALFANFCTACSSFIGLVIGILIGERTGAGGQWVFAVTGGMFLYIALVDMLPELMHSEELGGAGRYEIFLLQNLGMFSGFVIMFFIAFYEEYLVISL